MIQPFLNSIPTGLVYSAAFEPGWILATLGFILWVGFNAWQKSRFNSGKESDEERKLLRKKEIDEAMGMADEVLEKKLGYYARLSTQGREKFRSRLQVILATKTFIGKEGLRLTPEIEIMTAAAFVQVTFGLEHFQLPRFSKIVIYPDVFYNKLLERNLKGSASPIGVLRFSWKHIRYGYAIGDDNINLALHELAHALKVTVQEEDVHDGHLYEELQEFLEEGEEIRDAILAGKMDLIRKYAATNAHEFFACCVEYFFESPEHFKQNLPDQYRLLCEVLLQDPTNADGDYAFQQLKWGKPKRRKSRKGFGINANADDGAYPWIPGFLILGLFVGIPVAIGTTYHTDSPASTMWLFYGTIVSVGLLFFFRKFLLSGYMSTTSFSFFLFLGWTPILAAGALTLNFLVPVYSFQEKVPVSKIKIHEYKYFVVVKNSPYSGLRRGIEIDQVTGTSIRHRMPGVTATYEAHYGLFGLLVIDDIVGFEGGTAISEKAKNLYESLEKTEDGQVEKRLEWKYLFIIPNAQFTDEFVTDMESVGFMDFKRTTLTPGISMYTFKEVEVYNTQESWSERVLEVEQLASRNDVVLSHLEAKEPRRYR